MIIIFIMSIIIVIIIVIIIRSSEHTETFMNLKCIFNIHYLDGLFLRSLLISLITLNRHNISSLSGHSSIIRPQRPLYWG
jgi:hypothetical protein